jgi:hypothetical protein
MINVQSSYKNCASVVRKYLPITAAGGQPYFITRPPPHFSKSTGNNFLSLRRSPNLICVACMLK